MATHQPKTFKISSSLGCAASGIYSDARRMLNMLRAEATDYEYEHNEPVPMKRLVISLSDEAQQRTQYGGYRPFGATLLLIGQESGKPALYATDPSAEYFKFRAHAVGKNAQAVNAYLQLKNAEFAGKSAAELAKLSLLALRQAGVLEFEARAVEVAVFEGGLYRNLSEAEIQQVVQEFLVQNPIVHDESEDS